MYLGERWGERCDKYIEKEADEGRTIAEPSKGKSKLLECTAWLPESSIYLLAGNTSKLCADRIKARI